MSHSPRLDELVAVSPRFARSVSLVRDAHRADALDGYILTPTGRDVLRRLADALRGETSTRAWSLTGPYGSGKSAFALLAAQLLSGEPNARRGAELYLSSRDPESAGRFVGTGRLCPVLVSGSRRPLEKALATALADSLRTFAVRGRRPQIIDRLEQLAGRPGTSGTAIVGLFEEANDYLGRFGDEAAGILLMIDELGKFLEYGATNPEQGDIFVLQELAESATRSRRPFLFVTVLHQALDRYAEHMSPGRRAEWAKVQGRFEDVAFEERTEQMLRLLSHAVLRGGGDADLKPLGNPVAKSIGLLQALGPASGLSASPDIHLLPTSTPPVSSVTLLCNRSVSGCSKQRVSGNRPVRGRRISSRNCLHKSSVSKKSNSSCPNILSRTSTASAGSSISP